MPYPAAAAARLSDPLLLRAAAGHDSDPGKTEAMMPVLDPFDGSEIARVKSWNSAQVRQAIKAAHEAFELFRASPARLRATYLRNLYELMCEHESDLAQLITAEQGKPLAEALAEVRYGASYIQWFAEEAPRIDGRIIPPHQSHLRLLVTREPIGVCAAITPWNFPCAMITRKLGAAIACGCTLIIKPSEATPLSALALGELCQRAGFPAGIVTIVTSPRDAAAAIGAEFATHSKVRKISFTGSTAVGKLLLAQCAASVKRVSLELGGNAPFIVFEDADIDAAVRGAIDCKFRNSGQTCVAANRFLVHNAVLPEFRDKLSAAVKQLKLGHGTEPGVQVGPLINQKAVAKVQRHLDDAIARGAQVCVGGSTAIGHFFSPTVVCPVPPDSLVCQEETFGPLAALCPFDNEQQAIALANDTPAGLAAYFYTKGNSRIWRVSEALEYGMIGVNTGMLSTEVAPFGGIKESGQGREGSQFGVDDYLEYKYVCTNIEPAQAQ